MIIKANPIQIAPFQGSEDLRIGRGRTKRLRCGVTEMRVSNFYVDYFYGIGKHFADVSKFEN